MSGIMDLLKELKRRKLYSAVVAYVALSLVLTEVSQALVEALELPPVIPQVLTIMLLLGFPVVVVLAWIFDFGPHGVERTKARAAEPAPAQPSAAPPSSSPTRATLARAGTPSTLARTAPPRPPEPAVEPEPEVPADPERVRRITLAHVRHELKTPINAIIGYSEMLLEDAEEAGEAAIAADLERIRKAGRQLLALVEQILDPDREGEADLESYGARIRADLRNPINAVTGYAEMLSEECRESDAVWLIADLDRIRTAALRLLELSSDIVQVGTIAPGTAAPGAAAAGASLSQASRLAEGVLAKIRPLAGDAATADRQGVLLVVDDNAVNRDLVSRQLARKGYQVATAEHGREALDRLAEQPVDLVLLDVLMPEMDGVETLRRIKAQSRLRDVPVIMMSSLDEIDGTIRCIESGAEDYLTKPIHPAMLDMRIRASLEVRRLKAMEDVYRSRLAEGDAAAVRLLSSLFPASVAERLRSGEVDIADATDEATALWCDLGRMVRGGLLVEPADRVAMLGRLLGILELEADRQGLETVLLQGSAVLVVAGLPTPVSDHAERLAAVALGALDAVRSEMPEEEAVPLRFGLHTGAAAAAVVGGERLAYDVWGDAVDLARRLEAQAQGGQIHASPAAYARLKERFTFAARGIIEVPGRGQMRTFLLSGRTVAATTQGATTSVSA